MTKLEAIKSHVERDYKCRAIHDLKSDSYSWGHDSFKNFRKYGLMGLLVRMNDKLERLDSIVQSGRIEEGMCGESVEETCCDLINYCHIFADYAKEMVDKATDEPASEASDYEAD